MTDLRKIRLLHEATGIELLVCLSIIKNIVNDNTAKKLVDKSIQK